MADQEQTEHDKNLIAVYSEVCASYGRIDDFRARLLGLLPLFTGAGIFGLVQKQNQELSAEALAAAGAFGAVVTIGLLFYELRGVQRCIALACLGKILENKMKVRGQFVCWPHSVGRFINEPIAAGFVYSSVLAAWSWVGTSSWSCAAHVVPPLLFLFSFFAVWLFYLRVRPPETENQEALKKKCGW
ncbi:MAG: hypothetical protein ACU85E_10905 [Gammaproteobacteria bacterium]